MKSIPPRGPLFACAAAILAAPLASASGAPPAAPAATYPAQDEKIAAANALGQLMIKSALWQTDMFPNGTGIAVSGNVGLILPMNPATNPLFGFNPTTGKKTWGGSLIFREITPAASVSGKPIVAAVNENQMAVLSLSSGELLWLDRSSSSPGKAVTMLPTFAGDNLYASESLIPAAPGPGSQPPANIMSVRAYTAAAGRKLWTYPLPADTVTTSRPVVTPDRLFLTLDQSIRVYARGLRDFTPKSTLLSITTADGKTGKTYLTGDFLISSPVISGKNIAVVAQENLLAFDIESGNEAWRFPIAQEAVPAPAQPNNRPRDASPAPIVADDDLILLSTQNPRLRAPVAGMADPSAVPGAILEAIDAKTGKQRWSANVSLMPNELPILQKGQIIGHGRAGWYYALDRRDGSLLWSIKTAAEGLQPVIDNGVMYLYIPVRLGQRVQDDLPKGLFAIPLEERHVQTP